MPLFFSDIQGPAGGMGVGRVEVAAGGKTLVDYSNFTYDGNNLKIGATLDVAVAGTLGIGTGNANIINAGNSSVTQIQLTATGASGTISLLGKQTFIKNQDAANGLIPLVTDTLNTYTSVKLVSVRNNTVEKVAIDWAGNVLVVASSGLDTLAAGNLLIGGATATTVTLGRGAATTLTASIGTFNINQGALTALGNDPFIKGVGGAHTNMTLSTELNDVFFSLARTVQWATGAIATQRAVLITAPTYAFVGASTITTAATVAITGPPVAGTNATLTNTYPLLINNDAIGGSSNRPGISIQNSTAATGGATVQRSPGLELVGQIWDGSVSRTAKWLINIDGSSSNPIYNQLNFWGSSAGGAYVSYAGLDTAGNWIVTGNMYTATNSPGGTVFSTNFDSPSGGIVIGGSNGTTITIGRSGTTTFTEKGKNWVLTQNANTSGSTAGFTFTGAAHTTLTASTEVNDFNINLNRTVQWSTGAITTQRAFYIQAPTYAFVAASTVTTAATLALSGPPIAGTNATLTNAIPLLINNNALAATRGHGISLQNTTASTSGVPVQYSPGLEFVSHAWNTTGAADGVNSIFLFVQSLSNGGPAPQLWFYSNQDGTGYAPAGYIQPYNSSMYITDASNSSSVLLSSIMVQLYSGGSQLIVNATQAIGSSPSSAGYFSASDGVGTSVVYGSNTLIVDSTKLAITIGGTGGVELVHNGTADALGIFLGTTSQSGLAITPGGLTVYRPGSVFYDSSTTLRFGTDYIGYPSLGSLFTFFEDWSFSIPGSLSQVSPLAGAGRWSLNFFNASSGYLVGTSPSGYVCPTVQITAGSTSGASKSFLGTTRALVQAAANFVIATAEWDFSMASIGANGFDVYAGWASNRDFTTASPTTVGGVYFMKRTGDTNWQCVVDDGTTRTIVGSGVAPVANTVNTLRIDWFGATTYQGSFAVFWVDGNRCATISATAYAGAAFFSAGAKNASSGSTMAMQLGSVQITYNRFSAPPLPQ